MIGLASFMALACFFVPKRRFTGTEAATQSWGREATEVTKVLVKLGGTAKPRRLPNSLEEVLRLKAQATLETAQQVLQELERSVESARFERFAWLWRNEETHRRLELLPNGTWTHQGMVGWVEAAASKLDVLRARSRGDAEEGDTSVASAAALEAALEADAAARAAEERLGKWMDQERRWLRGAGWVGGWGWGMAVVVPWAHPLGDDSVDGLGWVMDYGLCYYGAKRAPRQDRKPEVSAFILVISGVLAEVIVYTYTGATPSVTLRRLSGVVLGKVAGSILQLAFAVKSLGAASHGWGFARYLHSSSDLAPVYGLTAAFAASSMIPSSGVLREISDNTQALGGVLAGQPLGLALCEASVLPTLMNTIIQTVFGISLMLLVDTILATRATKQARQRLGRAMDRLELCLRACASSDMRPEELELVESYRSAFVQDLDALKACLRGVANHMAMLCWLGNFAGPAVVQLPSWDALHRCWHQQARSSEWCCGAELVKLGEGCSMIPCT
eukprot:Skav235469  [mRNA]  locus=scaffold1451:204423:220169:+ [translate_table: standard]